MSGRNNITIQQLRYFVVAARLGSMTLAASELHIAQSAVSTSIAQLERQLDNQLLVRKRSVGLSLTPAGEIFAKEALSVLAHFDETIDETKGASSKISGYIRLACFFTLTPFILPKVLEKLNKEHPNLEVDVFEADSDGVKAALKSGQAELALSYDFELASQFETKIIRNLEPYVLLPQNHSLANKKKVSLKALEEDDFVLLDLPHSRDYFLNLLNSNGVKPKISFRSRNYETVRAMVARGLGYSILNQKPVPELTYDGGQVVNVGIIENCEPLPIVIAHAKGVRMSARARALSEAILLND